jgi:chromosome segregation ATPase
MKNLAEILESELEDAVEVKNKKSLHNYISILVHNILEREEINSRFLELGSQLKLLSETVKIGFENINKRFEDMNRRFEDINKRFEDMNKRFEDMNKRFEDLNKRFEDTNKRISIIIWVISLWMTLFTGLSVFLKLYQ